LEQHRFEVAETLTIILIVLRYLPTYEIYMMASFVWQYHHVRNMNHLIGFNITLAGRAKATILRSDITTYSCSVLPATL
jgi:hypothetical protein